jgi:hypothetical protein
MQKAIWFKIILALFAILQLASIVGADPTGCGGGCRI